jgi:putative ABC transport system permease protein
MMVLREGSILALAGTVLGILAALGLTRFGASLLYGVNPTDGLTFGLVARSLLFVALLACIIPARVAARLDPVQVLRNE